MNKSIHKHKLNYLLLSDSKMVGAKSFGIAFKVDDKMVTKYNSFGIDLEKSSGEKHHLLPVPSVFIVGIDKIIKFEYVNPDYKVRLDPDVLITAAKAALK